MPCAILRLRVYSRLKKRRNQKKKFIAVAALLGALSATALAAGYKNEPNGFRGIKWGTELSSRKDMQRLAQDKKGNVYYKRRGEKMKIRGVPLNMVWYREHGHRFESVYMESSGAANQNSLLAALERQFGPGSKIAESEEKYLWDGPKTRIFMKCNAAHTCELVLLSKMMMLDENRE